jgi:hypothetical protein
MGPQENETAYLGSGRVRVAQALDPPTLTPGVTDEQAHRDPDAREANYVGSRKRFAIIHSDSEIY